MSTIELNEFPSDAFRALLAISPEQREFIKRFMECSDEVQSVVRSMFAVLEYEHSTDEDKQRAFSTIADAFFLNPVNGHGSYGMDLTRIERDSAKGHPVESRRSVISNRLDQLDAQETSFADRLSQLLIEKNIGPSGFCVGNGRIAGERNHSNARQRTLPAYSRPPVSLERVGGET